MAIHSSAIAWKIPRTEEPGRLRSLGLQRAGPDLAAKHQQQCCRRYITMNKASGGDGIPIELFQILKDDAVKVPHSICQQI